ncbi:hypothetical protein EF888_00830 [Silicimonas algicola]|uniref:DUF2125 domain-containing protein n=1 Tax=Silicimonas algicola TaxID=1826607 RepID=A0A316G1L7_9RHOB|nr:hypothetical protein [Silicimonas algicola]AZQ65803.1 hypothetical protein EF888_00830 [Silicimonas algicola]PWK54821.1 hypothetical protein C8D95_110113 [Silicimonas algicola]
MRRTLAALLFAASPSAAIALTAEDALTEHLSLLSLFGNFEVETTGTARGADRLEVRGFKLTSENPDERTEITLGGVDLVEQPDGAVRFVYPNRLPVEIRIQSGTDQPVLVSASFLFDGVRHIVSGTPGDLGHDLVAGSLSLEGVDVTGLEDDRVEETAFDLEDVAATFMRSNQGRGMHRMTLDVGHLYVASLFDTASGSDASGIATGDADIAVTIGNLAAASSYEGGDIPRHSLDLALGKILWIQSSDTSDEDGRLDMEARGTGVRLAWDVRVNHSDEDGAITPPLHNGERISADFGYDSVEATGTIEMPEGAAAFASSDQGASVELSFSEDRALFSLEARGNVTDYALAVPDVPVDRLSYALDAFEVAIEFPLLAKAEPQPYSMRFGLAGLTFNDEMWSLFDPIRKIPRDPISLALDIAGTTIVAIDFFDEDATARPYPEIVAKLKTLRVLGAGLDLTGSGEITSRIEGATLSTEGRLDARLVGLNGLLDSLADLELLSSEETMGLRMMLGVFTRPGAGSDTLVSTIEFAPDGTVNANGQRIK